MCSGQLVDKPPGGPPGTGCSMRRWHEILALFDEWGEPDRSHRKLAHRGQRSRRRRNTTVAVTKPGPKEHVADGDARQGQ
ncbi:MAG TPA: hypothetical protein VLZ05_23310 [Mycobacterium sp.]|nr:hypothetical protein [Mycobacterium sp.]HUH71551.1 hypothetical protein [Mycobacterium sp.]